MTHRTGWGAYSPGYIQTEQQSPGPGDAALEYEKLGFYSEPMGYRSQLKCTKKKKKHGSTTTHELEAGR